MENNIIIETVKDNILLVQFNHTHYHNPFSNDLENAVTNSLIRAEENPQISAVILTGGINRSFSVGGDFNETSKFKGGKEVEEWIDGVINLYVAGLRLSKPLVAAIDNYAIGIGFQLAITCDMRIGTDRCQFIMPELKHGIACTIGQYMLEKMFGRAIMQKIVFGCEAIPPEKCLEYGLLDSITQPDNLFDEAFNIAAKMCSYPEVSFRSTKKAINETYIQGLLEISEKSKQVHRASFSDGNAQKFMKTTIKQN